MKTDHSFEYFSENICYLRKANNLSQQQMAQILGIGLASLRTIESGKIPPRLGCDVLFHAARYFRLRPNDLFSPLSKNAPNRYSK